MTGQLRTTLHDRADHLSAWDVDLDAIVRAGDRRVRRRRVAIAGGVAGVLAVVGGVSTLAAREHMTQLQPVDQDAKPPTYAVGSVIHSDDTQVDVGMHVDSFVRLTDRFVFTHDQHVYEARDGSVHELGPLADQSTPVVAGEDGAKVGWFGRRAPDGIGLYFYPGYLEIGDRPNWICAYTCWRRQGPRLRVLATWRNFLWMTNGVSSRVIYHDPTDAGSEHTVVGGRIPSTGPTMIQDAAADKLLVRVHGGLAVMTANLPRSLDKFASWHPERDFIPEAAQVTGVDNGDLAPDARHWFTTEGGFTIYGSSDGSAQEPEHQGFTDVTPYQWLSGDTIAATGRRDGAPDGSVSILTCRVSTNTCTDALADVGTADEVVLPNGPTTISR